MIRDAIDKILMLNTDIKIFEIEGRQYTKSELRRIPRPVETAPVLETVHTLTGFVDCIKNFIPPVDEGRMYVHIRSPYEVMMCGDIQPENFNHRFAYFMAQCKFDEFRFSTLHNPQWYELELFVIALQSLFVPTETITQIIDMLGHIINAHIQENKDDGFTQTLQVRTGLTTKEKVTVKNPVTLQPWRTFREIDQPEVNCILRFRESGGAIHCSLWEADGDLWQYKAMTDIKKWLERALADAGLNTDNYYNLIV